MKNLFVCVTVFALTVGECAFGQGTVNIGTGAGASTKFITTYTGARIAGDAYWAQLFYANGSVTDENALMAAGNPVHPRTGAAAGVLPSGEVRLERIIPPGGVATLQLRVWSALLGDSHDQAYQAWQSMAADPCRLYGRSALFTIDTGNPLASPPETPPSIGSAFPGITFGPIPEPSTMAFGLLGGIGALLVFQRRKRTTASDRTKTLAAIVFATVAGCAFGQGTVNIGTGAGAFTKFITTYTGERIAGDAYWAQLFYANGAVADESLLIAAGSPVHPRTRAAAGVLPSNELRLEGITPPGGITTLQVRAWSAALGNSHDEAYQEWRSLAVDPSRVYGRSSLFQIDTAGPFEHVTPPSIGSVFPGMTLYPIPEPSTVVLGIVSGIGALIVFQRRKRTTASGPFPGMTVYLIPEPSTMAFGVLGAIGALTLFGVSNNRARK